MLSLRHKVPPLGGCVSLQAEFKCLIFCVSRSAFVCTLKGLDSNKWKKKINRRQCMKCWGSVCVWSCVCERESKLLSVSCLCVSNCSQWRQSSAARVPGPGARRDGARDERERWKAEREEETIGAKCAWTFVTTQFCGCVSLDIKLADSSSDS